MNISRLTSRQVLDSRGRPTLETTVEVDTGVVGIAAVPSGASTGSHEAVEIRDEDSEQYGGAGVQTAVENVTGPIAKALKGMDVRDQRAIDQTLIDLDGTVNKSKLGGNALLSVSLAVMRASAALQRQSLYRAIQSTFDFPDIDPKRLPRPMMNIMNGGKHADNKLSIQEFMIVPNGETMAERIERGVNVYHLLGQRLREKGLSTMLGDEGGYAPKIPTDEPVIDFLSEAVGAAGLELGSDVQLSLDLAATTFYDAAKERYHFGKAKAGLTAEGMIGALSEWLDRHDFLSLEDPLAEDDWAGWAALTEKLKGRTMIVGDDLFVTNVGRLERGIAERVATAILIKPNQVGTLSETVDAIMKAQDANYTPIVSHRSGETIDSFIADLAVAVGAPFIKAGAPARGERVAKYNRLLQIEQELLA